MKDKDSVFLFEYATCTSESLPSSVAVEGQAMFKTLYKGFSNPTSFYNSNDYIHDFEEGLDRSDYALTVAPETDGELLKLTRLIDASGCQNMGSRLKGVKVASDKLLTYKALKDLSPRTEVYRGSTGLDLPLIAKPRDGVSGEGVRLIECETDLERIPSGHLVQEQVKGAAMSASVLIGRDITIISINTQELEGFSYRGAKLPVDYPSTDFIVEALERLPGLHGYVGLDFIETVEGPMVIEVNPRPTTPIIGFKSAFRLNLSRLIMDCHNDKELPTIKPRKKVWVRKKHNSFGAASNGGWSIEVEEIK